jgi:hypothetical protein
MAGGTPTLQEETDILVLGQRLINLEHTCSPHRELQAGRLHLKRKWALQARRLHYKRKGEWQAGPLHHKRKQKTLFLASA